MRHEFIPIPEMTILFFIQMKIEDLNILILFG